MQNLPKDEQVVLGSWVEGDYEITATAIKRHIEGFTFRTVLGQTIRWNVTQAQEEIAAGRFLARSPIDPESMRAIADANEWTEEGVANADTSIDGIAAPIIALGSIIYVLIDGTHRLVRCMREGKPFFAKLLTDDANRRCVLMADDGMVP